MNMPTFKEVVETAKLINPQLFTRNNKAETMRKFQKMYRNMRQRPNGDG